MTARRRLQCCVEGCSNPRQKRHAVCDDCFSALLRKGRGLLMAITAAHKACDPRTRNIHGQTAGKLLGKSGAGVVAAVTASWSERADLK
jgi:hypothetical protein